jgi:hypothetical protein
MTYREISTIVIKNPTRYAVGARRETPAALIDIDIDIGNITKQQQDEHQQ